MSVYASQGMSYGMACLMVAGILFTLMGALLLLLVAVRVRGERRRARAERVRADAAADRAHAAVMRAQAARDRAVARDRRRSRRNPGLSAFATWTITIGVLLIVRGVEGLPYWW